MRKVLLLIVLVVVTINYALAEKNASGNALTFDGTDDYVVTNYYSAIGTLEFWFKTNDYDTDHSLFGQRYDAVEETGNWQMHWDEDGEHKLRIYGYQSGATGTSMVTNTIFETDTWYHIAVISNGTSVIFYVNGEKDSEYTFDGVLGGIDNDDPLYIGGSGENDNIESFNGLLDEVRVWNDVRTATEIKNNMWKPLDGDESDLVAYYNFDEEEGTTLEDITGNGYDGTLTNMTDADWVISSAFSIYTVSFVDYDGTTELGSESVYYGEEATAPSNPTRKGYTFTGWDVEYSEVTSDITVTAQYTATTYSITYNLDGGTNDIDNPESYTIESETITLYTPTKSGYSFVGWYTDEDLTTTITEISEGSTGNIKLWAEWAITTSISTTDESIILVYPNPSSSEFYVRGTEGVGTLYNMAGKKVLICNVEYKKPIDISSLPPGIYILNIKDNNIKVTKH